jgi:hypothetical protein
VVVVRAVWQEIDEIQKYTIYPERKKKTVLEGKKFKQTYLIGSVIVWVSILIGTVIVLSGTPYVAQMVPILGGGALWFILCVPAANFWSHPKSDRSS